MSSSVEYAFGYSDGKKGKTRKPAGHLLHPSEYLAGYEAGASIRRSR